MKGVIGIAVVALAVVAAFPVVGGVLQEAATQSRPASEPGVQLAQAVPPAVAGATQAQARPPYEASLWHPIHFRPAIDKATNDQCLACHQEVLTNKVRATSPAGLKAAEALAWYQTLDTYTGDQETFHARHLTTPFASKVMQLKCNFCHTGHDPREEAPGSSATAARTQSGNFALRKTVNPSKTCLLCHGRFNFEVMEGVEGPWHEVRKDLEDEDIKNGCLTCHEELFRTVRHQVSYLKAKAIEESAKQSSDVCHGCHGGRAWFRTSYPYPRHPWPDMPEETPEWAKDRPAQSDERYRTNK